MAFDKIKAGLNKVMEMTHLGQDPSVATDQQEMAKLKLLVEELKKKCAVQAKNIEKLEQNNDRLVGQNKQLEGQNKQLEDETKQLRSKTQQLSEALIHEKSLVADLNKKLGAFIDIVKEARDTVLKYLPQGVSSYGLDDVELDHEGIKRLVYSLANMAIEYVRKRQIIDGLQHNFFGSKSERLHYSHDQSGNPSGQEPTFAGSDNGSEQTYSVNDDETVVTDDATKTATQDGGKPEVNSAAGAIQCEEAPEAVPGDGASQSEGKAEEQPSEAGANAAENRASKSEGSKSEPPENNKANELKETIESVNELQETVSQKNKGVNTLVDNAHSAVGNQETEELLQKKKKECEKLDSKEEKSKITKILEALGNVNRLMSKVTRLCEDNPKENKPSPGRQVNPHLKGKGKHVSVNYNLNSLLKELQKLDPNCIPEKCVDPVTGNVYEGHAWTLISNARKAVVSTFGTMISNVELYEGSVPLWICEQCGTPLVPYPNPKITGITEHGNHLSITVLCRAWAQYAFAIPQDRLLRFTEEKYGLGHDTIQYGMDLLADLVIMGIFILIETTSKKKLTYAVVDETPLQSLENKCQGNSHSLDAMVKKDPTIEGHYFVDTDKEGSSKKGSKSKQSDKSQTVPAVDSVAQGSNNGQKSQTEQNTGEGSTVTLTSEEAESIENVIKKSIKTVMGACGEGESDFLFDAANLTNGLAEEIKEMKLFDELYAGDDDDQDGEKKRKPCAGYVLAITSHPADEFQVVLFKAMAGRSSEKIAHALEGFNFYGLMRDGYSGYIKVKGNIVRWVPVLNNPNENEPNVQVCGIHFRRPIFDLLRSSSLSKELDKLSDKEQRQYFWDNLIKIKQMANGETHVTIGYIQILSVVMLLFQLIYRVEKLVPIDDPDYFKKIAEKRSNLSAPLWDCICQLMDILVDMHCTVDPKTQERKVDQRFPTHKVLSYWLTNKDRLSRFLSDPHLRFDTLDVERTIRPITLLRKNINYFTSEEGRQRYCQWMSIVETLRLYGVDDVEQYLIEATRYMIWCARQKMLPELLEKLRENPKYFDGERNPLYMKNIRNYARDIDWTPFLPWNVGTNEFTKGLKSNNSKRRFFEAARRLANS